MMKEVVRALETGMLPQIALFTFLVAFLLIVIWAMRLPASARTSFKHLPLNDPHQHNLGQKDV